MDSCVMKASMGDQHALFRRPKLLTAPSANT
jgi:hypothetical protein